MFNKWSMYIAAAVLSFLIIGAVQSSHMKAALGSPPLNAEALHQQVAVWQEEIAKQEPFKPWQDATADIAPLGPGTHSWLAILKNDGQAVGYMVIHARPEGGYVLGEYGLGESPLFSAATLRQALAQHELIPDPTFMEYTAEPIYYGPLHAVWKVTLASGEPALYFDGTSGEQLPYQSSLPGDLDVPGAEPCPLAATAGADAENSSSSAHITEEQLLAAFDPYASFPWLTRPTLDADAGQLAQAIEHGKQLIFTAEPWDNALRYVWAIRGLHRWQSGSLYIAADHNGLKYIPAAQYVRQGSFYSLE